MIKKLMVLLLTVAFVFGLAACGNGESGSGASASNPVADFLATYGDELDEEFAMLMGGGSVALTAGTGNELIFTFNSDESLGEEGIEMVFDIIGSTFVFLAGELAEEIEIDSLRLTIHFYDADGNRGERSFDS